MRNWIKTTCISLAIGLSLLAIFFFLSHERALILHPQGEIAESQLKLIIYNVLLMLVIILPFFILLFRVAWKYREKHKKKTEFTPEQTSTLWNEIIVWGAPALIVFIMAPLTWFKTHELDPYKPLESETKPITIQVVALNWKWLFIYPEKGIATINYLAIPEKTPIHFLLTADGSPMNSFWIPQLSGQIYCMTGMITQLHLIAEGSGIYSGQAAEINGEGYSGMRFEVISSSFADFNRWIENVKKSTSVLSKEKYDALVRPSVNHVATFYTNVEPNLFNKIVMKYMR